MPIADDAPFHPHVQVLFSPVVELVLAATLVSDKPSSLKAFDGDWQKRQRDALSPRALAFLDRTRDFSCPTLSVIDYVMRLEAYGDVGEFLTRLGQQPLDEFLQIVLNGDFKLEEVRRFLADPEAARTHTQKLTYFSRMSSSDLVGLFQDPEGFRRELIAYLGANQTQAFQQRLGEMQTRYQEGMADILRRLGKKHPLEVASELKKRPFPPKPYLKFTFVPSYFEGLMNLTCEGPEHFLFIFNVYPNSRGGTAEGMVISEKLRILGDRSRLEILRLLAVAPSYGKEIASRLDLTTATVSRHLDQLKSADLVVEDPADSQNVKMVRINRAAFDALVSLTRGFIFGRTEGV